MASKKYRIVRQTPSKIRFPRVAPTEMKKPFRAGGVPSLFSFVYIIIYFRAQKDWDRSITAFAWAGTL